MRIEKLKWIGFFLSEHTTDIDRVDKELAYVCPPKPEMDEEEIGKFLQDALMKHKKLAIQLNYTQLGKFMPDITGFLSGHNDLGIYIGSTLIEYGEIRNIDFYSEKSGLMCDEYHQYEQGYLSYSEFINEFLTLFLNHRKLYSAQNVSRFMLLSL